MIDQLGTEYVNFYLLEEAGAMTLIDAGLSKYGPLLEPALARAGRTIDDVRAIVLTHADPDHVGFAGAMQQRYGTAVYVHRLDAERTRTGTRKTTEGKLSPTLLLSAGSRETMLHMVRNGIRMVPVEEVTIYEDGDVLDVPGRLQAVHTPGHSDGHCVLRATGDDAVFIGDAITNRDVATGRPGLRITAPSGTTSTEHAYASLARIEAIDAGTLYFGHGLPSTAGARTVVAEVRAGR